MTQLWFHLSPRRRIQLMSVLALMLIVGVAEVASLGAVLPFLSVMVAADSTLRTIKFGAAIADLATNMHISSSLLVAGLFCVILTLASALRVAFLVISTRLAGAIGSDLSIEVYRRVLHQPYSVHVARNGSEIIGAIVGKVNTTANVVYQHLVLVCSAFLVFGLIVALIAIDARVAIISGLCLGSGYLIVGKIFRRMLRRNSQQIAEQHVAQLKNLQEGLGGIRDVLLDGSQNIYCKSFKGADRNLRKALADNAIISGSPRYLMENVGIILIVALAYGMSAESGGFVEALPVLGSLALAAQRLLPAMQQSFAAWAIIAGSHASVLDTIAMLEQPLPADLALPRPDPLALDDCIELDAVSFRYTATGPNALNEVSLRIPRGARVGFIGETGCGKSTLVDLIMGLLVPTSGCIRVDGVPITGTLVRAWQSAIAHVPQSIFLSDASVAENIAFGVEFHAIDLQRVKEAAHRAQIAEFIESRSEGYAQVVGERGVRLSGGQRQRIGIARALYKQSALLVLDEATSALDSATEQAIMDSVNSLDSGLTILMIAHRLSTLKDCDIIYRLENGRVAAQGTYDKMIDPSPSSRCETRSQT
ncbi:ABC transporter ATP-binding protein [Denitratisoma sp. agr-D3]